RQARAAAATAAAAGAQGEAVVRPPGAPHHARRRGPRPAGDLRAAARRLCRPVRRRGRPGMTPAVDDAVRGPGVFVLAAGDGAPAFVLSDLPVPAGGGAVVDALAAWLACARDRRARVFVLGDLFDSYVSARQLRVGVWRDVAELFARAVHAG